MSVAATARRALAALGLLGALLLVLAGPAWAQGVALEGAGRGTAAGLRSARLANHLGLAGSVGLLLLPAWLLEPAGWQVAGRRATRLAALVALLWALSSVAALVFGLSNAAARPLPEALTAPLLERFATTRFGTAVVLQGVGALAVAGLAAVARNRAGARLALLVALAAAAAPAWWGHANTADARLLALSSSWLHVAAASVWVGGLAALVAVVVGARGEVEPRGPTRRFSRVAGWAILVVGATGVLNTALHTTALSQLLGTTWGRLATAKAVALLGLAALGWAHRRRAIPRLRSGDEPGNRRLFLRIAAVELVIMVGAFGLATTMASGVPANVEAALRLQQLVVPLGEGFAEISLDPGRTGRNELHLYVYDADRALRDIDDATVVLRMGDLTVEPRLIRTGTGHYTGPAVEIPVPGTYRMTIGVEVEGAVEEATGTLTVR